jgi:hypothetical protein
MACHGAFPDGFSPELRPEVFLFLNFSGKGRFPARQAFVHAVFPDLFRQGRLKPFVLWLVRRWLSSTSVSPDLAAFAPGTAASFPK